MIDLSANMAFSKHCGFEECFNGKEEWFCRRSVSKDEILHGANGKNLVWK